MNANISNPPLLSSKLLIIMFKTLFVGFLATFFLSVASYLSSIALGIPQPNWELLGRWFIVIAHGQLSTPSLNSLPPSPHEKAIGILMHLSVSIGFTLIYILICTQHFIRKLHPLVSGLLFGLLLMIFPIFVEYPSMGVHIFNEQSPYLTPGFLRIITCHSCFGLGLGLGRLWLQRIKKTPALTSLLFKT